MFDVLFSKIGLIKNNLILKYNASREFNINFFKTHTNHVDLFKSLNVKRGMWSHDLNIWNLQGIKGRELADYYLSELQNICSNNNIKLSLVIYPWPIHIYHGHNPDFHRNYWKKWSKKRNIKFIDLFDYFETENPKRKTVKRARYLFQISAQNRFCSLRPRELWTRRLSLRFGLPGFGVEIRAES